MRMRQACVAHINILVSMTSIRYTLATELYTSNNVLTKGEKMQQNLGQSLIIALLFIQTAFATENTVEVTVESVTNM